MRNSRALIAALVIAAAPAWGAERAETVPDMGKQQETIRKGTEELQKELERNQEELRQTMRELLKEARKNQPAVKEMIRELTRDKKELEKTLRGMVNDPELRKGLKELGDIIGDSLGETGKQGSP